MGQALVGAIDKTGELHVAKKSIAIGEGRGFLRSGSCHTDLGSMA